MTRRERFANRSCANLPDQLSVLNLTGRTTVGVGVADHGRHLPYCPLPLGQRTAWVSPLLDGKTNTIAIFRFKMSVAIIEMWSA